MKNMGIKVGVITSAVSQKDQNMIYDSCLYDADFPKILYLTPEKLSQSNQVMNFLQKMYEKKRLDRFVIDEAHCVSSWGRDFRPDYVKLGSLKANFPTVPTMALTATASEKVIYLNEVK